MAENSEKYDVIIVGAGPTGLAAAVYTGREDLKTLVIDGGVVGGLIATTEIVDNYPGFPEGIGGLELADAMGKQAKRFGAEIKTGVSVSGLTHSEGSVQLHTSNGDLTARSILVATGSEYRKLDVPGEKEQEGKGVHYCATCDGPLYRGAELIVVGGGNSALQEGLFLTKFAKKITFLVRGPEFKGSEVLIDRIQQQENVDVLFNTRVESIKGEVSFEGAEILNTSTNEKSFLKAEGMFIFIGLIPNTEWLKGSVELDDRGFVKVDKAFSTNLTGTFAAGDVVVGSVGQVAAAVGEGVSAALSIRQYLDPSHALPSYAVNQA